MDKNTIAGLVIIFLILIGFSYLTRPSKEQVAEMQRKQDSIARVDRLRAQELAAQQQAQKTPDNTTAANPLATKSDSIFVQNDTENKIITLKLRIDTSICAVMDYFEIFLTRMTLCRSAAAFLGMDFELVINETRML